MIRGPPRHSRHFKVGAHKISQRSQPPNFEQSQNAREEGGRSRLGMEVLIRAHGRGRARASGETGSMLLERPGPGRARTGPQTTGAEGAREGPTMMGEQRQAGSGAVASLYENVTCAVRLAQDLQVAPWLPAFHLYDPASLWVQVLQASSLLDKCLKLFDTAMF